MASKTTAFRSSRAARSGMTLVEMMIAVAIGSILLAVMALLTLHMARGSAAVVDYVGLTEQNRISMDRMTKRIRQASEVTRFSPQEVEVMVQGSPVRYYYDAGTRCLYEVEASRQRVMLEDIETLQFQIFQRNALAGTFEQVSAGSSPQVAKLVQVSWRAASTQSINPVHTDGVTSIRIALRAK